VLVEYFVLMEKDYSKNLCLALDNLTTPEEVKSLVSVTSPFFGTYKVGMELFTRFGPSILDSVFNANKKVFLDLKYHDIPQTVANAVISAARLGVHYVTIHTQGGSTMMKAATSAALKAVDEGLTPPKLIGVTLLTSIDANTLLNELNVSVALEQHIKILALRALDALLDGIVCSAADLPHVKYLLPEGFEIITPGIRLSDGPVHDQKRIATPKEALSNGATLLVIGRAVTESKDPVSASEKILASIS
jgi:orotidine-5'-phosphate decarboxylase